MGGGWQEFFKCFGSDKLVYLITSVSCKKGEQINIISQMFTLLTKLFQEECFWLLECTEVIKE